MNYFVLFFRYSLNSYTIRFSCTFDRENENQDYAFTYSDLITRVIPQAVLTAYPHQQLTYDVITETVKMIKPTPPFKEG